MGFKCKFNRTILLFIEKNHYTYHELVLFQLYMLVMNFSVSATIINNELYNTAVRVFNPCFNIHSVKDKYLKIKLI